MFQPFMRQNSFNPDHSPLLSNGSVVLSDGTTMRVPVQARQNASGSSSAAGCSHLPMQNTVLTSSTRSLTSKPPPRKEKYNIDHLSKMCFPSTFVVWNIIFFSLNIQLAGRYDVFAKVRSFLPW